jgi:hypothetical protein
MIDFSDIDNFDNDYNNDYLDFDGHEDFKEFLDDNSVLDEFIKYFKSVNDSWVNIRINYFNKDNIIDLGGYLDNIDRRYYISSAFNWVDSGDSNFWYKLNCKWNNHVKNGG